ncbi:MAG TPA: MFS transporter [Pseudomonadales bacterium]|nr:MFS transporter [Pseudomonadales bacterium]
MTTRARTSSLWFFGVGNLSPAIKGNLMGAPVFFYYNNVLHLDAWLVSLALAISLVIDAFTDPLVGYISDYTSSRWGRRHPYIVTSIIPGALFYWALPNAHFGNSQAVLFVQLLVLMAGLRLAWTFYQVPKDALAAEISKDYQQRTQLYGINSFFGWIGGAIISYLTSAVFLKDSYSNAAGYSSLADFGAIAIALFGVIFVAGTAREIPALEKPQARPKQLRGIFQDIIETLNHRSWLMLFSAGVVFSIYVGLTSGLAFYFNSYFWDWKPKDVAVFSLVDLGAAVVISGLAGQLARKFDKKRLAVTLFIVAIVVGPIPLILRLLDIYFGIHILPANGPKYSGLWWVLMVHSLFTSAIGVLAWVLVGSMTADVVEDSQRKTGKRAEGLFFAGPHLVQKCVSGLGLMIKGLILTAVGFSATAGDADKIMAIQHLAGVIVVLGIVLPFISLYLLSRYEITRETHTDNLENLGYVEPSVPDPVPVLGK